MRILAALLIFAATVASAQEPGAVPPVVPAAEAPQRARASERGLVLELRTDFGLEELLEVRFDDGSTGSINLDDGFAAAVGVSFLPLAEGRFATRASVGLKFTSLQAANGDAFLWSIPLEITENVYAGPFRLAAGPSFLLGTSFSGSDFFENTVYEFGSVAPGVVFEAEWIFAPRSRTGIGMRASWHRFDVNGVSVDGPSLGAVLRADFDLAGRK